MPKFERIPSYRLHKSSGRAVVTLNGRDIYLGVYGSPISREKYDRLIRRWLDNGRDLPSNGPVEAAPGPQRFRVTDLVHRFWTHAKAYYRKDDQPLPELYAIRAALRPVRRLYGQHAAAEFGPLALKAVREEFLKAGLTRKTINDQVARIRRMFAWAVENEMLEGGQLHALKAVPGLRRGRCNAPEGKKIRPVPDEDVEAVLPYLPPTVADVVRVQRLTGMRSCEVLAMRPADLDRTVTPWRYVPQAHKTSYLGHSKVVPIGPRARAILTPYLLRSKEDQYLFSPQASEEARNAARRRRRKSPMTPSQSARRHKRTRDRAWRERYDTNSYRRAITRACKRAGVPRWTPHRLRHTAGTAIRRKEGLEMSRTVLGLKSLDVAEIYAERDLDRAARIVEELG